MIGLPTRVLLAVRIGGREAHVEPGLGEQPFLDADDDRQVEHRIVGRNAHDGLFLGRRHGVLTIADRPQGPDAHAILAESAPRTPAGDDGFPRLLRVWTNGAHDAYYVVGGNPR